MQNDRRAQDKVVQQLIDEVALIRAEMKDNTDLTREIRGIVAGFRFIGRVAKWLTYIAGLVTAGIAVIKGGVDLDHTVHAGKIVNPGK